MSVPSVLHYDLLVYILEPYHDDYSLLSRCALVNWEFNRAASKLLYFRVVLSPPFRPVLNLRDPGFISAGSNLPSALLPRNAPYVIALEVSGYISSRPPPRNTISETILSAVKAFTNLAEVKYTPVTFHEDLFTEPLKVLKVAPSLRSLTVNGSCMDEKKARILVQIGGLDKLTLKDPTRALLQLLPDWLRHLSSSLTGLHLLDNCGSVTPGVLKSFLPHVKQNLRTFTIGLSYSLTDQDVFVFLGEIRELKHVQLRYYWQLKPPHHQPPLPKLRTFIVNHPRMYAKDEVLKVCKWIRRAIASSSIETLRIAGDIDEDETISTFSHDSLVDHLVEKQKSTLRVLDIRTSYVGARGLMKLLTNCTLLEEIYICGGKDTLTIFSDYCKNTPHIHTALFDIHNVKRNMYRVTQEEACEIFVTCPSLRRLTVNGKTWEVGIPSCIYGF
ncbi:hypothetical protein BDQ17DRAFT_1238451 [Cyathus striatus]|nr:hypothetical protein BDQ17DRAFT_1238451 [Cyathus striatus]